MIPISWVDHVDDKVCLNLPRDDAKAAWREKDAPLTAENPSGPATLI